MFLRRIGTILSLAGLLLLPLTNKNHAFLFLPEKEYQNMYLLYWGIVVLGLIMILIGKGDDTVKAKNPRRQKELTL